jgi:hypothetical protein
VKESNDQAPDAQKDQGPQSVTIFRPYQFQPGQKINISGGPRRGDWEVIEVGERKIKLRCPVSLRVIECDHFCFFIEEATGVPWPRHE